MQIKSHGEVEKAHHDTVGEYRTGSRNTKVMLTGQENTPTNYLLSYGGEGSASDWATPRHRHIFDQLRYNVSGDYVMRNDEVLPAGWVAYFPQSVYYGPQVKSKNLTMLTLQFGGPNGYGFWSSRQRKQAFETLKAQGRTFEDGICFWTDSEGRRHNQDAAEACLQHALGIKKLEYPQPRYSDIVMMNPASYDWVKDKEAPGVAHKKLGVFTERDVRVSFIQMEKGATIRFGVERSPEILFLKEGVVAHDNSTHMRHTAFGTEADEQPVSFTAVEPSELVYMKLPTF